MNTIRNALVSTVIAFDQKQSKRAYHNVYALAQYLARIDDIMDDIKAGANAAEAITAGFTPGPLRKACLKACGFAADQRESHGNHLGLPVYRKITER